MIWKIMTGVFVILSGIIGFTQFDDRYAKCDSTQEGFDKLEVQVVQTLEKFQHNLDIRQYDMMQDTLERDYDNCKRDLRINPNDSDLAETCEEIKQDRDRMRTKKKELMGG